MTSANPKGIDNVGGEANSISVYRRDARSQTLRHEVGTAVIPSYVNPYHKPKSLLDLSPRGLVPTLHCDNKPLYESTVVCKSLEDAYPDHGLQQLPTSPYDRARMKLRTDFVTRRSSQDFMLCFNFKD